jgi:hypothetical protein
MERHLHRPVRPHLPLEVRDWRRHVLAQAGFAPPLAAQLAAASEVDLHDLLRLVDRGCPPELAARILAPL